MKAGIEARGLVRTFPGTPPVRALRGVDLRVPEGRVTAVLGPSGCGKTTLLRVLAGLERPDAGTVEMAGRTLDGPGVHVPPERRTIGIVPQEGALFPHLDVRRNVAFGLPGRSRQARDHRVDLLLELVGLPGYGPRRPDELSGGQQQRVALARALAPEPDLVLLDEPFSALDTSLRASVRDEVMATLRLAGATGVLVTHDQTEAMAVADLVAVMREGRIVQTGPPADVYRRPVDLWVAGFLGQAVVVPGCRPAGGSRSVTSCFGALPLAAEVDHHPGPAVAVCFRPEQVVVAAGSGEGVVATVRSMRFNGPDATLTLAVGDALVAARVPSTDLPEVGDVVHVRIAGAVLAFDPADAHHA